MGADAEKLDLGQGGPGDDSFELDDDLFDDLEDGPNPLFGILAFVILVIIVFVLTRRARGERA
jgi:hypothetical protein